MQPLIDQFDSKKVELPHSKHLETLFFKYFNDDVLKDEIEKSSSGPNRVIRFIVANFSDAACDQYFQSVKIKEPGHRLLYFLLWMKTPWNLMKPLPDEKEKPIFEVREI